MFTKYSASLMVSVLAAQSWDVVYGNMGMQVALMNMAVQPSTSSYGKGGYTGWVFDGNRGHRVESSDSRPDIYSSDYSPCKDYKTNEEHSTLSHYCWHPDRIQMESRIMGRNFEKIPKDTSCKPNWEVQKDVANYRYKFYHCWENCPAEYEERDKPRKGNGNAWTCRLKSCAERSGMLLVEGPDFCAYTRGVRAKKVENKNCTTLKGYTMVENSTACVWQKEDQAPK